MSVRYIIRESIFLLWRARSATFGCVISVFLVDIILSSGLRISLNLYHQAWNWYSLADIEVFIHSHQADYLPSLKQQLKLDKRVDSMVVISRDSAKAIFLHEFGAQGLRLTEIDFLPVSLRIISQSPLNSLDSLVTDLRERPEVDEVIFDRPFLEVLRHRLKMIGLIGLIIIVILTWVAYILISYTIKLSISTRKSFIDTMKLLGATKWFIRLPFIWEGIWQGLIAGGGAMAVHYIIFSYMLPEYFPLLGVVSWPYGRWFYLTGAILLFSVFITLSSAWRASKKYV